MLSALACQTPAATGGSAPRQADPHSAAAASGEAPATRAPASARAGSATSPARVLTTAQVALNHVPESEPQSTTPASAALDARRVCRVAAIGDSLTDARSGGGKYLKYLEERCPGSTFDNFGVGGEMVNQMRRRFSRDVARGQTKAGEPYTHVIVFGGVNDLYSDLTAHRTVAKIEQDLGWMYGAARDIGAEVVAITVTPWGGFRRYFNERRGKTTLELNAWIRAQQGALVSTTVDAYPLLSCGDVAQLCPEYATPFKDGLHFGPEGHRLLGERLYARVFHACQ